MRWTVLADTRAYSPLKKKYVTLWKLDTVTVTLFGSDTQSEESKTYYTDFIRYHLHFSESHCPDRLRRLVNEGKIIQYLDDIELKVSNDAEKMLGLENCFVYMAREVVFKCMVYKS